MKELLTVLAGKCDVDAVLDVLAKHRDRYLRYEWATDWRTSYEMQQHLCADADAEVSFEASEMVAQIDWDGGTYNSGDE